MQNKKNPGAFKARDIAVIGLLIALSVVLTRFVAVETQLVRVSFTFLANFLIGVMYGPWIGAFAGAAADLLGFFLFSRGTPFSPGFTLSAAAGPMLYGLLLYRRPLSLARIALAFFTVMVTVNLGLNSLWLKLLYDQAFWALLPARLVSNLLTFPIEVAIAYGLTRNRQVQQVLKDYPIKWIR